MEYNKSIPDYGDLMSVDEFKECVHYGIFIDYDGYGYPVKDEKVCEDVIIIPSKINKIPEDTEKIVWFNR